MRTRTQALFARALYDNQWRALAEGQSVVGNNPTGSETPHCHVSWGSSQPTRWTSWTQHVDARLPAASQPPPSISFAKQYRLFM